MSVAATLVTAPPPPAVPHALLLLGEEATHIFFLVLRSQNGPSQAFFKEKMFASRRLGLGKMQSDQNNLPNQILL